MIKRLFLIALFFFSAPCYAESLQITEAWIKNLPMVVPMRAGYMNITNKGSSKIAIESLASESFAKIEIHQSIEIDGMMSMQPIPGLVVLPGESIQLQPGGYHLMMMNPLQELKLGDKIIVTLRFDDQTTQTIIMIVRK